MPGVDYMFFFFNHGYCTTLGNKRAIHVLKQAQDIVSDWIKVRDDRLSTMKSKDNWTLLCIMTNYTRCNDRLKILLLLNWAKILFKQSNLFINLSFPLHITVCF